MAAYYAYRLAGFDVQVDVGQGVLAGAVLVGEVDVVEVDVAVGNLVDGVLGVVQVGGLAQDFAYTADAGHRHAYHDDYHAEHHEAHQQAHDIAEQAGEVAFGEAAADYELRAEPGDHYDAEVDRYHHRGVIEGKQALCLDGELVEHVAGLVELLALVAFAHKGLYHADGADVLLHAGVQVVVTAEDLVEDLERHDHYQPEHHHEENDRYQEGGRYLQADVHAHCKAEDEVQRGAHCDAGAHHEGQLHVRDVGGHTSDQTGHRELVDVGEGEGLYIIVNGLAQICRESGGGVGRKLAGQRAEAQADDRHEYHQETVADNNGQVALLQAVVDYYGRYKRKQDFHYDLERREPHGQESVPLVAAYLL